MPSFVVRESDSRPSTFVTPDVILTLESPVDMHNFRGGRASDAVDTTRAPR
jgi:hypothetical protein